MFFLLSESFIIFLRVVRTFSKLKKKMFLLFLSYFDTKGYETSLGFFSTSANPYASKKLHGFQTCPTIIEADEAKTADLIKITRYLGESRVHLNFTNTENGTLDTCTFKMTKGIFDKYKHFSDEKMYLSFHSAHKWTKSNVFTQMPNGSLLFTHFTFYFATKSSPKKPVFQVTPSNPVPLEVNKTYKISFSMDFSDMPIDPEEKNHVSLIFVIVFVLCCLFSVVFRFLLNSKFPTISVLDMNIVWSPSKFFGNQIIFPFFGLLMIFIFITIPFFYNDEINVALSLSNCVLIALFTPVSLRVLFSRLIKDICFDTDFISITLFIDTFYGCAPLIVQYINWLFFGANVSLGLYWCWLPIAVALTWYMAARAIGYLSFSIPITPLFVERPPIMENANGKQKNFSFDYFTLVIYCVGVTIISIPVMSHVLDIFLDSVPINFTLLYQTILLNGSIAMMFSLIKTYTKIKYEGSWMTGHSFNHLILGIVASLYYLFELFFVRNVKSFTMILYGLSGLLSAIGFIMGVGLFFSFFIPFVIVYSIFNKTK